MIQKMRGTMDILPDETPIWRFTEEKARNAAELFGFSEIRFPTFEATELFSRGVGGTSDVVQKEMYTFSDRDGRSVTLRPEGTACVARSLIENGLCSDTMPKKLYYLINCFRYEKPQAGRSREFFQFGAEMFGAPSPAADAEIISLADTFIRSLGIKDASLHINSIGCRDCRSVYHKALKAYFSERKNELCETCKSRLETNPMRILDCKSPICREIAANAPVMIDYLCDDCRTHFETLKTLLAEENIAFEIDTHIVRGLDYYTRTVFEFICPSIGAQSTICGGGRYDGLIEEIGGPSLPGIGFAAGVTRLLSAMEANGVHTENEQRPAIYIAPMGEKAVTESVRLANALRGMGIRAETDLVGRSLKAQMKYADKKRARFTLILGENELACGKGVLKNMDTSGQTETDIHDPVSLAKAIGRPTD